MEAQATSQTRKIRPAVVLDKRTIQEQMIDVDRDLIRITDLGRFGFTNQIILDMAEFEVFPQVYKVRNHMHVMRKDIFGFVQKMLENSMTLYRAVDDKEKAEKALEAASMPLDQLHALMDEAKVLGITDPDEVNAFALERKRQAELAQAGAVALP